MNATTEIRQIAFALLEQLPGESLVKVVEFLESLDRDILEVSESPKPPGSEATLLQIIQRHLSPEERERLTYLRSLNKTGEITETEHQELLIYVNQIEQQDADRAAALIELAQLRQVDLKVVIEELLPRHSKVA